MFRFETIPNMSYDCYMQTFKTLKKTPSLLDRRCLICIQKPKFMLFVTETWLSPSLLSGHKYVYFLSLSLPLSKAYSNCINQSTAIQEGTRFSIFNKRHWLLISWRLGVQVQGTDSMYYESSLLAVFCLMLLYLGVAICDPSQGHLLQNIWSYCDLEIDQFTRKFCF